MEIVKQTGEAPGAASVKVWVSSRVWTLRRFDVPVLIQRRPATAMRTPGFVVVLGTVAARGDWGLARRRGTPATVACRRSARRSILLTDTIVLNGAVEALASAARCLTSGGLRCRAGLRWVVAQRRLRPASAASSPTSSPGAPAMR